MSFVETSQWAQADSSAKLRKEVGEIEKLTSIAANSLRRETWHLSTILSTRKLDKLLKIVL